MAEITIITKEMVQRGHMQSMKRAWSRNSKPVIWNNQEFESAAALRRHLKLESVSGMSYRIKRKLPIEGHLAVYKNFNSQQGDNKENKHNNG